MVNCRACGKQIHSTTQSYLCSGCKNTNDSIGKALEKNGGRLSTQPSTQHAPNFSRASSSKPKPPPLPKPSAQKIYTSVPDHSDSLGSELCPTGPSAPSLHGRSSHGNLGKAPAVKKHKPNADNPEKNRPYACDRCGLSFQKPAHLKAHKESVHENLRKNVCDKCNRKFNQPSDLTRHMKTHLESYPCPNCELVFYSLTDKDKHVRSTHAGAGPSGR